MSPTAVADQVQTSGSLSSAGIQRPLTAFVRPAAAQAGGAETDSFSLPSPSTPLLQEQQHVPVAADGSFFGPHLRRAKGFWIGRKGEERHVADFDQALDQLRKMPQACWRRPNAAGNWGIVTAVGWKPRDSG